MQLADKIGKLRNGQAFTSAQRHIRETLFLRPQARDLTAERLIQSIQSPKFDAICRRYPGDSRGWPKYFNLAEWIPKNLARVRQLGLDCGLRKTILDLGCGAGYFLFISQYLGHDVLGLDLDDFPLFREMIELLGLSRVIWRIQPYVRLPIFQKKFDLITAFMICFNGHKSPKLWGRKEWQFFVEDASTHLKPNGRICLSFNSEPDGTFYTRDLARFFADRGGQLNGRTVILPADSNLVA
jgi:SAM-dependent methyltransferase